MTPKEKAEHLYNYFAIFNDYNSTQLNHRRTIHFCINICDEILLILNDIDNTDDNTLAYNYSVFYNRTITELKSKL